MKSIFIVIFLSISFVSAYASNKENRKKPKAFTSRDASVAIDAFHQNFFNPATKVYNAWSDKDGRAAIWTQAIFWDMMMNAYKRTDDPRYLELVGEIYEGACSEYDNFNWNNTTEWFIYDDIMWWVISLCRAYELTGDENYLSLARTGFDRVWYGSAGIDERGSYDKETGGMRWGWKRDEWKGKMACINYPTVIASALLYRITKQNDYLDKSLEIYHWANENLFNQSTGAVADSKHGDGQPAWKMHLYNQATCMGSGVILYQITAEQDYLDKAILAADYVKNEMCDENGFLPFENGIEQGVYAAIFAQYIAELIACEQIQYLDWIRMNMNQAWENRDRKRNLSFKNVGISCPTGPLEVYDTSGCPALMQVVQPAK